MKSHVVVAVALMAGLQWASARTYKPVPGHLPSNSAWPDDGESSLATPHIVGGTEAEPHSHPHQVWLDINVTNTRTGKTEEFGCGGSLISDSWVVTAAHCVDTFLLVPGATDQIFETTINVNVGSHNRTDEREPGRQIFQVTDSNIFIHPDWNMTNYWKFIFNTYGNDIAVLKLNTPVRLDGQAKPIRLPKESQKSESFYGFHAIITGWGRTENNMQAEVLQEVSLKVLGDFHCKLWHLFFLVKDTNICLSGSGYKGSWKGDSGGPMIIVEDDNKPTLIGVTSFHLLPAKWGWPSVYTRVTSYLDWILATTAIPPRN